LIGNVAATFHFPPSELWEMSLDDLLFWHVQAERINRRT
jgi:hypothetical protein